MTCLSNQQKGFMVCGYTERLQWERKTSGINLAKPPCVHLNLQHCFKLHRHQLHQLDLRWRMIRSSNRSDSKRKWGGDLFDKTFNVQAHLLLHISSDGMCLKDDTAWIMKQRKREKQMNNYLILVRSHLAPFFFAIPSTSKLFSLTFNFSDGGGGRRVDIKH